MPTGTTISANTKAGASGAVEIEHPFKIYDFSDADGPAVAVVFGQINSITPTIDDTSLDDLVIPWLGFEAEGLYTIYLQVNLVDAGVVDTAEIHATVADGDLPDPDVASGYLALGTVRVESVSGNLVITAINQTVTHSLQHRRCGVNDHHFWGI